MKFMKTIVTDSVQTARYQVSYKNSAINSKPGDRVKVIYLSYLYYLKII